VRCSYLLSGSLFYNYTSSSTYFMTQDPLEQHPRILFSIWLVLFPVRTVVVESSLITKLSDNPGCNLAAYTHLRALSTCRAHLDLVHRRVGFFSLPVRSSDDALPHYLDHLASLNLPFVDHVNDYWLRWISHARRLPPFILFRPQNGFSNPIFRRQIIHMRVLIAKAWRWVGFEYAMNTIIGSYVDSMMPRIIL